jgi:hypothetical protein
VRRNRKAADIRAELGAAMADRPRGLGDHLARLADLRRDVESDRLTRVLPVVLCDFAEITPGAV